MDALGALALGMAAGLPFATIFEATQRLRPGAPGAAAALVNGCAVLSFSSARRSPGSRSIFPATVRSAFVAIAALSIAALAAVRRLPTVR